MIDEDGDITVDTTKLSWSTYTLYAHHVDEGEELKVQVIYMFQN
ncbi:hypothetical protein [Turicibacter bilis]|nr:hypothetical protein [Turicibacter bilis]